MPKAESVWQDQDETMPKKKKPKRFRAVEAVKAMARERIGTPRPSRAIENRKKTRTEKYKPTLGSMLDRSE
jgi:hypothetical protein